ncbi:hypothetical protein [Geotalea sp. SG265]|uniref:hypothetical protein n=1 Tax=Geotalea sp. SG265 TaxID=2922867 RepID=UPI001FAE9F74|nr:hypothetical protein [Geotalea sp. SG265]
MKFPFQHKLSSVAVTVMLSVLLLSGIAEAKLDYLYNLSNFNGAIASSWVNFGIDRQQKEIYVINPADQSVDVFNNTGLVVHSFGDEGQYGSIRGLALDESGSIYLLSNSINQYKVFIADFRGELNGVLKLEGLSPLFTEDFRPDRIFCQKGHLYLVDTQRFKLLVTDLRGHFEDGFEFASIIGVNAKKRSDYDIRGLTMDEDGTMIFTIPVQSLVYLITPDKKLNTFGRRGSSPGKFNVVGGVAVDDKGFLYVADTLRCVIMVFNRNDDFKFLGEYGYRGFDPGNLIAPMEIAVAGDLLYVSQSASRGVSVYRISRD